MRPDEAGILAANLAALSESNSALADRIQQSAPSPALAFRTARNGAAVPVLRGGAGELPFHSMVDPGREAERLLEAHGDSGYLVCLGLGGGFLATAFLRRPQASGLLIIEKDAPTLRTLLSNLPLSALLTDGRVRLTAGVEEIRDIVCSTYLPALSGDLLSLPVRSWCEAERKFFDRAARELRSVLEEIRGDYAAQASFGKRWFSNMIQNLPAAEAAPSARMRGPMARSHVTAAGPSLEDHLRELADLRDGSIIFATDTSLPALLSSGLVPPVVVSLDCQVYSYHHFLAGVPSQTEVFFDLASPPFLVRRVGARGRFFTSAHPLARFIWAAWRRFPTVDTTGGNVTHAAVSLARALGIRDVRVHGADFSYPRAKPYARGTYLYDYFQGRQQRCAPLESSLCTFVLRSAGLTIERSDHGLFYTTAMLRDYKTRLENLMRAQAGSTELFVGESPARCTWREFLGGYAEQIRALPHASAPLGGYFNDLRLEQKALWATLLPITARVLKDTRGAAAREVCLEQSRHWALDRVDRMLSSAGHGP